MGNTRSQIQTVLMATGLFIVSLISGCAAPSYYSQAVSGHMQLMNQRQAIDVLLDSGTVDPELSHSLELAVEIRNFAVNELDLPDNGSYTQFVQTGQNAVTWNVVAAPEFSLSPKQWCFLVSGCVPYRGYFNAGAAAKFASSLDEKGYDTFVSPAIAYSTLGWFDDPLVDTMFQYNDDQLAAFMFHEMAHQKLYVKGDTSFNEAYARFVEDAGLSLWRASREPAEQGPGQGTEQRMPPDAAQQFNALLQSARDQLGQLYASDTTEENMRTSKTRILEAFRGEYQVLVESRWGGTDPYRSVFAGELNNASLALINAYEGGSCAFAKLFQEAGNQMAEFHRLAAAKARLSKTSRSTWLNKPCEVIASDSDL